MTYGIKSLAQILESGVIDRITQAEAIAMVGAAPISHASAQSTYGLATQLLYGHAKSSSTTPSAPLGAGAVGTTFDIFALADHVHPVQTEITGTAALATRLAYPVRIGVIGAATAEAIEFDGSEGIFLKVTRLDPYALDVPVPVDKGGTGIGALTKNSILYAKETNEWGQIPPGTSGQLLTAGATGVPEFKTLTLPQPSDTTPKDLGTASTGSETAFARGDHVHHKPSFTASDVGAAPIEHNHTVEQITDLTLTDYLQLTGGWVMGPLSTNTLENKGFYYGIDHIDLGDNKYVEIDTLIPSAQVAFGSPQITTTSLVILIDGYRQGSPINNISFGVAFSRNGSGIVSGSLKWVNYGSYAPTVVNLDSSGSTVKLYLAFSNTDVFLRISILAAKVTTDNGNLVENADFYNGWASLPPFLINGGWVKTPYNDATIEYANGPDWAAVTQVTPADTTHTHALANITDWPTDVVNDGVLIIGNGDGTIDVLEPPTLAGTKWLKIVTSLDPNAQTINWDSPAISDITGLTAALNGKSATGHTHNYLSTAGGTVTGTITSTATTIMYKAGASGVVTFVSGDMVVASKLALSKIDPFRYTNVYYLRDADGDVSATQGSPTQLGSSQHTAGTDSVLHLIIGGTSGLSADFTRYLNLPELGTGALEGDKIEMVITNLSSTYKGQIQFNPSTSTVTFRTVDGLMLTQSERYFASGERIAFHAIKTTSGGSLCWRVVKTSETAF